MFPMTAMSPCHLVSSRSSRWHPEALAPHIFAVPLEVLVVTVVVLHLEPITCSDHRRVVSTVASLSMLHYRLSHLDASSLRVGSGDEWARYLHLFGNASTRILPLSDSPSSQPNSIIFDYPVPHERVPFISPQNLSGCPIISLGGVGPSSNDPAPSPSWATHISSWATLDLGFQASKHGTPEIRMHDPGTHPVRHLHRRTRTTCRVLVHGKSVPGLFRSESRGGSRRGRFSR